MILPLEVFAADMESILVFCWPLPKFSPNNVLALALCLSLLASYKENSTSGQCQKVSSSNIDGMFILYGLSWQVQDRHRIP